jgi:hypothetical protein
MKFQKRLEAEAPEVLISDDHRRSLVKYKLLKKHISSMDTVSIQERNHQPMDEDCCICTESFQFASRRITTSCGHSFHHYCLIASLGAGSCSSCPLCRAAAGVLVPSGPDGDCLRFMAMVHVNAKAVQRCHDATLLLLEARSADHHRAAARRAVAPPLLAAGVADTLWHVDATMRYGELNYEGFRKILKKFDKRTGCAVSSSALADLQRYGFCRDAAGNGRCTTLRGALVALLATLQPQPLQPQSPAEPAPPTGSPPQQI